MAKKAELGPRPLRTTPESTSPQITAQRLSTPEIDRRRSPKLQRRGCALPLEQTIGEIGPVDDFVIDDGSWTVRHIVVDTLLMPRNRTSITFLPSSTSSG